MYDSDDIFQIVIITFVTGFLIGGGVGSWAGKDNIKTEAVKAGTAHYEAGADGRSVFKWGAK